MHSKEKEVKTERIDLNTLQNLLEEHGPEFIQENYSQNMDEESRAYFQDFQSFCGDLDQLSGSLDALAPLMPAVESPVAEVVPFKRAGLPVWAAPLLAAAAFFAGMLLPTGSPEDPAASTRAIELPNPNKTTEYNNFIAEAFFERGAWFSDEGQNDLALADLKAAHAYNPKDTRTLELLIFVSEQLGMDAERAGFEAALTELEATR